MARTFHAASAMTQPRETIYMDILPAPSKDGITPRTAFSFLIIFVNAFSWYTCIIGLPDKSTAVVAIAICQFKADCQAHDSTFRFINIEWIKADAGSQFMSEEFKIFCQDSGIALSLVAPKKLSQNHFAEWS